jgi:hypothetical protein
MNFSPDAPVSLTGLSGTPSPAIPGKDAKNQKAMIVCVDDPKKDLTFQFNPTQIKFSKSTTWNSANDKASGGAGGGGRTNEPKRNVPTSEFQGGSAQTLSMDLLFDTTDTGKDVRKYTDFLTSLTLIKKSIRNESARPALVKFVWGNFSQSASSKATRALMSFTAYVKDVNITFSLFLPDGTPVRAETQVTFTAQKDEEVQPFQNPTSRSEARKLHVVNAGETLDFIAYNEYGDATQWRHIASVNGLTNPKDLRAGQALKLTPLP